MEVKQLDALSIEFLGYVEKARFERNFETHAIENFFKRGLNANDYRIEYDGEEHIIEPLLGEVFWEIQGLNDDYFGEWVVTILNLFVEYGLDITLLDGAFITEVFGGLSVSTRTSHIFDAIQILLNLNISVDVVENAIDIFEFEAADLYVPFDDIPASERFDQVVDMLNKYRSTLE